MVDDLQAAGHACWIDTSDIPGGEVWLEAIAAGIEYAYAFNAVEWCLNKYEKPRDTDLGGDDWRVLRGGKWISAPVRLGHAEVYFQRGGILRRRRLRWGNPCGILSRHRGGSGGSGGFRVVRCSPI